MTRCSQERQLTALDHARLSTLVDAARTPPALPEPIAHLAREVLDAADIVEPTQVPSTAVTMRSRVLLETAAGAHLEVVLSYPAEADASSRHISVFSPLGFALLGAEEGHAIQWSGPSGDAHKATVVAVLYQPEAAGDLWK